MQILSDRRRNAPMPSGVARPTTNGGQRAGTGLREGNAGAEGEPQEDLGRGVAEDREPCETETTPRIKAIIAKEMKIGPKYARREELAPCAAWPKRAS